MQVGGVDAIVGTAGTVNCAALLKEALDAEIQLPSFDNTV
jgi:hypothetical protein